MTRLAAVLLTLILLFPLLSCNDGPTDSQAEPEFTSEARSTIGTIFLAVKMYRQDYSQDPPSVEELESLSYVDIDPDLKNLWTFRLVGSPRQVSHIYAESTDTFPKGPGHTIIFDAIIGRFISSGFPDIRSTLYCSINSIIAGAEQYKEDHHRLPATFKIMHETGYVHISQDIIDDWDFMFVHNENETVSIHAIKIEDDEESDFNLINYYTADDQFERLLIDDQNAKEIMRVMPDILEDIFFFELDNLEKPYSMILDPNIEIWDKFIGRIIDLQNNYQITFWDRHNRPQNIDNIPRFILPIGKFAGRGFPRSDLTDIRASFAEIFMYIRDIHSDIYLENLIEDMHFPYSEDVMGGWDFFFQFDGRNYYRISAVAKEFNDEYDFHFATINMDYYSFADRTEFTTSCARNHAVRPVVIELENVIDAILRYRHANQEDANSVEELEIDGFLNLDDELKNQWSYSILGSNPVSQLEACSTEAFPEGAGHVLLYDFQTGVFLGYGMEKSTRWEDQ